MDEVLFSSASSTNFEIENAENADFTSEKCVGTEHVDTMEKGCGNHVSYTSVKTQFDPKYCINQESFQSPPQLLKVKIPVHKVREKSCNTNLSFSPHARVIMTEEIETETETDESEYETLEMEDFYTPSNSSDSDQSSSDNEDLSDSDMTATYCNNASPLTEPKFIVFWSCLMLLFRFCFTCFQKTTVTSIKTKGSLLIVTMRCAKSHTHKWYSQPIINRIGAGNVILSAAILYSGNTFMRISEMFSSVNLVHFSRTLFYNIQKTLLYPTLNSVYKLYRSEVIKQCIDAPQSNFIGDGRCDSPGYSAKYGTYTLMDSNINKIVDFHVVSVGTVENSSRMEKKGLEKLLSKLANMGVRISTLTTDRHVQIRSFLKNEHPEIIHQFDIWHFGKSIKKALTNLSKKKGCEPLTHWIKAIINHFWWCCASCNGDAILLKEKWLSILYHIRGIHSWDGTEKFSKCEHPTLDQERRWLKDGSEAFLAIEKCCRK